MERGDSRGFILDSLREAQPQQTHGADDRYSLTEESQHHITSSERKLSKLKQEPPQSPAPTSHPL